MYLVFDIGGTHIRSAVSKDGNSFDGKPLILDTPKIWEEAKNVLSSAIKRNGRPERVCVAIAGEFDEKNEKLASWTNQPDWVGKPLKSFFETETCAPVVLINDAAAAAIAEARRGAGKGFSIVAYLTVSTGVGGARVVDGFLDKNAQGFEPGRQIIDAASGETLEYRVSGSGFSSRFGPDFAKIVSENVWKAAAKDLAIGVHNTIDYWSPDVMVLGGPLVLEPKTIPFDIFMDELRDLCKGLEKIPPIKKAALGDGRGLYGALDFLVSDKNKYG